ncbi:6799_t:CDS:2, partial [Ambispora leptoticha]
MLTADEICYCATCSTQQEQIRKNLDKNSEDINNMVNDFNKGVDDYVENKNNDSKQNSTNPENQAQLEEKKQQLKELQEKEQQLFKSLPITTQISNLKREIKQLESKSTRTKAEETLLTEKKKALA